MATNKISNELGKLRRSAVVMTFGPGSIVDFRAEGAPISAIVGGLDEWDRSFRPPGMTNKQIVFEPRLQRKLGVSGFRLPPVVNENYRDTEGNPDRRSLVAVRFPIWLQCPQCDRIGLSFKWGSEPGKASRYCSSCTAKNPGEKKVHVIPVRFVMACEAGHLDEFPWHFWVGHKSGCKLNENNGFLRLQTKNPGLSGIILSCPDCGASKSMDGIFSSQNWTMLQCRGKRPWLGDSVTCDRQPNVVQRGASNLYFPVQESALSIPPWSDKIQESLGIYWDPILNVQDMAGFISALVEGGPLGHILEDLNLTVDELVGHIKTRINKYSDDAILDIRLEEYRQLVSKLPTPLEDDINFETRNVPIPDGMKFYFSNIVRIVRLREVMAIKGFTRIHPPGDENDPNIAHMSIDKTNWLPAIEIRGEGIFMEFNHEHLLKWEQHEEVQERASKIQKSWVKYWMERYKGEPSPVITPRYLLVHTWAHALMSRLTLECGYSSASLRERLYISDDMAGLLIYTTTSDSDGTLGGLQRQGLPDKISKTVRAAVKAMEWCSSDPLCIEGMVAAPENHSGAACHACCLAPETSCEKFNRFLDRAMLVGIPGDQEIGYFSSMLKEE